jgi:hypothetical protein
LKVCTACHNHKILIRSKGRHYFRLMQDAKIGRLHAISSVMQDIPHEDDNISS